MTTDAVRPDRVIAAAEGFLKLATDLGEAAASERVKASLEKLRLGLVRLVIAGEARTGKSSFINALLSEPGLLPTSNDITTSTVFKIVYGKERRYRVFFAPTDPTRPEDVQPPKDITTAELSHYGTEDGNPYNEKAVDFIAVELPNPLLKQGLVIIDTPGLGGLFKQHALITWRYLPNADALFFVLESVEKLITVEEIDALDRIHELTKDVFFVQTKIDLVDERVWQEWRDRNLQVISQHLKVPADTLRYFPISNELKKVADELKSENDLEWSGYPPLLHLVSGQLIPAMHARYASALLNGTVRECGDIRRRLVEEQQVFAATSAERLNALERQFRESRERFDAWERDEYPAARSEFEHRFRKLGMDAMHRVQTELDPSPHGTIIGPLIDELRRTSIKASDIFAKSGEISGSISDACGRQIHLIQAAYDTEFRSIVEDVTARLGRMKSVALGDGTDLVVLPGGVGRVRVLEDRSTAWDKIRQGVMGKGMGAAIGFTVATVFAAPAAIVGAAMALGGLLGTIFNLRNQQYQSKEAALAQLANLLSDTIRTAQTNARQYFERTSHEYAHIAADVLKESTREVRDELRQKFEAVREARQHGQAENTRKAAALQSRIDKVDAVLRQAAGCLPARAAAE